MDAMDLDAAAAVVVEENPGPELVLRPGDWYGPVGERSFRVLHERVAGHGRFRARLGDTATVLEVVHPDKARRMGPWATFGPDTYRGHRSTAVVIVDDVIVMPAVDAHHGIDTLCEPTCPMRMPGQGLAMCRECWHALVVDYGTLLADLELVRLALALHRQPTDPAEVHDLSRALVAAWHAHPLVEPHARGRVRLRAARLWYAATVLLGDPVRWEAWCACEYLAVALLSPTLYGPLAALDVDTPVPMASWFAAVSEAYTRLGPRVGGASLFFQTSLVPGTAAPAQHVRLRGGAMGDAVRLAWRPMHHLAWARDLLATLSRAPTTAVMTDRVPADVTALLHHLARGGDGDPRAAIAAAHAWREGLGSASHQWLATASTWLGLTIRPEDAAAAASSSMHWRARLSSLESLRPLLPPCLATVVDHGRQTGALKHDDRFYTANYLAALGQRDVKETRAFLVGNAATAVADIEDVIGPPRRGRKAPTKPYLKSCERIRRETRDPSLRPAGNVMACPFDACAGCGLKARLPVRLDTIFDTPLGFLEAKLAVVVSSPATHPPVR